MVSSISPLKIYEFYKTPKEIVKDTQNTVKQLRWIFWRKLLKNFKKLLPSFAKSSFLDVWLALRKKCPYSELFCSVFSRVRTEYGEILRNFPYSVRIRENPDQNNSEYGLCSCSVGSEYSSKSLERILFFFCNHCVSVFGVFPVGILFRIGSEYEEILRIWTLFRQWKLCTSNR